MLPDFICKKIFIKQIHSKEIRIYKKIDNLTLFYIQKYLQKKYTIMLYAFKKSIMLPDFICKKYLYNKYTAII